MNTGKDKAEFKKFLTLLDSGCSSTILIGRIFERLNPDKDAVMQWHTKDGNITTNLKVKLDLTLLALSA